MSKIFVNKKVPVGCEPPACRALVLVWTCLHGSSRRVGWGGGVGGGEWAIIMKNSEAAFGDHLFMTYFYFLCPPPRSEFWSGSGGGPCTVRSKLKSGWYPVLRREAGAGCHLEEMPMKKETDTNENTTTPYLSWREVI